ncbi:cystathionine beta-lyase [Klebsiella variicola]|uniref:cysteine-S-conjugate beta-lyase n=1 Tax=Klebsiella variicola TaxID=244366 RepID=A0ABD7PEN1_KLEVA|nr:MalY/PatB family protein [Klebsiella variicola]SXF99580.1 cystathionine beta-lyase [Klebsiella variicola]
MDPLFDTPANRKGTNAWKWDASGREDVLPFHVADMDFRVAPSVQKALVQKAQGGIFGYSAVPGSYFSAIQDWFSQRYQFRTERDWIIYTTGVLAAITATLKATTRPGDGVIVQTPVYHHFFTCIKNSGCQVAENPLVYREGRYTVDFVGLEKLAANSSNRVLLLCHPHNPVGRRWSGEELERIAGICARHQVLIISDEIHCDLVHGDEPHIPLASLSAAIGQNTVTCTSPSKGFNLAGLQVANIICANSALRGSISRYINIHEVCDLNSFAVEGLIAAYTTPESRQWLEAVKTYICGNYTFLTQTLQHCCPGLYALPLEATYLAWIDCTATGISGEALTRQLFRETGVLLSSGHEFGENGRNFIRINLACPRQQLSDGLLRMSAFFATLENTTLSTQTSARSEI